MIKTEKKVFITGQMKAICLPKDWVIAVEKKYKRPLRFVKLEVDGETLKITPLMKTETKTELFYEEILKPKQSVPKEVVEELV